jgi:hypothetical protein
MGQEATVWIPHPKNRVIDLDIVTTADPRWRELLAARQRLQVSVAKLKAMLDDLCSLPIRSEPVSPENSMDTDNTDESEGCAHRARLALSRAPLARHRFSLPTWS